MVSDFLAAEFPPETMRIIVKAKPSAREEKIELLSQPTLDLGNSPIELDIYKVWVTEPPVNGRANHAILRVIAEHFNVAISSVKIVSGQTAKKKIIEVSTLA